MSPRAAAAGASAAPPRGGSDVSKAEEAGTSGPAGGSLPSSAGLDAAALAGLLVPRPPAGAGPVGGPNTRLRPAKIRPDPGAPGAPGLPVAAQGLPAGAGLGSAAPGGRRPDGGAGREAAAFPTVAFPRPDSRGALAAGPEGHAIGGSNGPLAKIERGTQEGVPVARTGGERIMEGVGRSRRF